MSDKVSDLYVAQSSSGHIKIGRSTNIRKRMRTLQDCSPFEVELVYFKIGAGKEEAKLLKSLEPFHWRGEWHVNSEQCRKAVVEFAGIKLIWPFRTVRVLMPKPKDYKIRTDLDREIDKAVGVQSSIDAEHQRERVLRRLAIEMADPSARPKNVKLVKARWYWVPPDAIRKIRGVKSVALGAAQDSAWALARSLNRDNLLS